MRNWIPRLYLDRLTPRGRAIFGLVFGLHIAFALFFVFAVPINGGPDEDAHVAYVKQLATEHSLPLLREKHETRDSRTGAIGAHPPLAYVLGTPVYAVTHSFGENTVARALRMVAVVWSVCTLLMCWVLLNQNFPTKLHLNLAALAFAGLLPHFSLLSSVWNSDGLLILLSAVFLWRLIALAKGASTVRDWLLLGVLWGCLLLTKATALLYIFPVALILIWKCLRRDRAVGLSLVSLLAFAVPGVVMGSWWFIRFKNMTGSYQPIPDLGYQAVLLKSPLDLILDPNAPILVGRFLAGAMRSIWGQVDWSFSIPQRNAMNQTLDFWTAFWGPTFSGQPALFDLTLVIYRVAVLLSIGAVVGLLMRFAKRQTDSPLRMLTLFFGVLYGALGYYTLFKHPGFNEGGRYLLPALTATAALWVWGLSFWIPEKGHKWLAPALIVFFVLWNVGCGVNLVNFLVPFYAAK